MASVADASATEGADAVFDITIAPQSAQVVTVRLNTTSGTAAGDIDYNQINTFVDVAFNPGETAKQVGIQTFSDAASEGPETFDLNILQVTNGTVGDGLAVGTIVDDDPAPPTVVIADASANEGSNVLFDVTLSFPPQQAVTVEVDTSPATAAADVDYDDLPAPLVLSFDPGETVKQVSISTMQDTDSEGTEFFDLNVTEVTNALAPDLAARGSIVDDEPAPPTLTISDAQAVEGGDVVFTFTLSFAHDTEAATVRVNTTSGTATGDIDYNQINTYVDVIFAPGETVRQLTVQSFAETSFEPDETFDLNVLQATNMLAPDVLAVGTILNDDPVPPTLTISDAQATEGSDVVFTLTLSFAHDVEVATVRVNTTSGTATGDIDYNQINTFVDVTFDPGETVEQVTIQSFAETNFEPDETFDLNVLQATNVLAPDLLAVGTILNDDAPPPTVTIADASATEGSNVVFDVVLSVASAQQVTVEVDTAPGTAASDVDYHDLPAPLIVSFNPGETVKQVNIPTLQDTDAEGTEFFDLNLIEATNAVITDSVARGSVVDDEPAPPTLTLSDAQAVEGSDVVFTLTLSFAHDTEAATVRVNTTSGTATGDIDYNQINSYVEVTFDPGETVQQVTIQSFAETDLEPNETFDLNVILANNVLTPDIVAVGTILNDDGPPPSVSAADVEAEEGGNVAFSLTLSAPSNLPVTVRVSTSNGSATGGTDFDAIDPPVDIVFAPQSTVQLVVVPTFEDPGIEANETFALNIVQATNATVGDATAQGTIVNDDTLLDGPPRTIPALSPWMLAAFVVAIGALGAILLRRRTS